MISSILAPGVKIGLIRLRAGLLAAPEEKQYSSRILDVMEDEILKIVQPAEDGAAMSFEKGTRCQLVFFSGQGLYQCVARILEGYNDGTGPVFEVQLETDLEKYRRRQYYRLECTQEIQYRIAENDEKGDDLGEEKPQMLFHEAMTAWNKANLADISGGGCRFYSRQIHEAGQIILVRLNYLCQENKIDECYRATLIHSQPVGGKEGVFEHRLEFLGMNVWERERLIKFIFEEERKRRRRERGLSR